MKKQKQISYRVPRVSLTVLKKDLHIKGVQLTSSLLLELGRSRNTLSYYNKNRYLGTEAYYSVKRRYIQTHARIEKIKNKPWFVDGVNYHNRNYRANGSVFLLY